MVCDQLEDDLRNNLDAILLRYQIDRNPEDKQEFLRLLKQFSDLIICGKKPPTHDE
jgi:hypothetical protein